MLGHGDTDLLETARQMAQLGAKEQRPLIGIRTSLLADLVELLERLERENLHLRGMVAQVACAYGQRMESGLCRLGYPGCACEDDVVCLLEAVTGEQNPWIPIRHTPLEKPCQVRGQYVRDRPDLPWRFEPTHWRPITPPIVKPPAEGHA